MSLTRDELEAIGKMVLAAVYTIPAGIELLVVVVDGSQSCLCGTMDPPASAIRPLAIQLQALIADGPDKVDVPVYEH